MTTRTRILRYPTATFAIIPNVSGGSLDVLLAPGARPSDSLRRTSAEWREKAARLISQAERAELAASELADAPPIPTTWPPASDPRHGIHGRRVGD